jgi:hypothetical protein
MDGMLSTIGLFAMAGATVAACVVALILGVLPQVLERRRGDRRAAFLRAQLLHRLTILPPYLRERDRSLPLEHRDILDEFCCLAQHASLLELEEWTSVLRTQGLLMMARNRPSFTKREARTTQHTIDHCASVLRAYGSAEVRIGAGWKNALLNRRAQPPAPVPSLDHSMKLRDTAG